MKRSLMLSATAAAAVAALFITVGAVAGGGSASSKTITVIEHATTDATTDTGAAGDSAGDILTFANEVFDAGNTTKVGTDQGYCIRIVAGASYECIWTTFLPGGQITVEGPFFDAGPSTLAITGGTGKYRKARGTMDLSAANAAGTEFRFAFHLGGDD